jgi:hypothetical protein
MADLQKELKKILKSFLRASREFIYGMTTYETVHYNLAKRGSLEHLFFLLTLGDLIGVPIVRPYYSLRLLPFVATRIDIWKHLILREKDITDTASEIG